MDKKEEKGSKWFVTLEFEDGSTKHKLCKVEGFSPLKHELDEIEEETGGEITELTRFKASLKP